MIKYETVRDDHGFLIRVPIKKPKSKLKSESVIQKEIASIFVADGWEVIRYNSGVMQGDGRYVAYNTNINSGMTGGHPDLGCFKSLRAVRIEVKTSKGKKSTNQEKYAQNALKYNNPIMVMRSKEDAIKFVESYKVIGLLEAVKLFSNL